MDWCLPRHITPFPSSHPPSLQQPFYPKTALNPLFAGRTVRSVSVKEPRRNSRMIASASAGHCEYSSSSLNSPLELRSQPGKFLSSVLQNHRQLFRVAVEDELKVLANDRDSAVSRMLFSAGSDEACLHRNHEESSYVWSPHPLECWKINFDVAIRRSCAVAVVVCRDHEGHLLFAWTKSFPPSSSLVGEARAPLFAAQEVSFLRCDWVVLEGDSKSVIDAVNAEDNLPDWQILSFIEDIHRLRVRHSSWSFVHVKCEANSMAHELAKWAAVENFEGNVPLSGLPNSILSSDIP